MPLDQPTAVVTDDAILSGARAVFAAEGFETATFAGLAASAGLSEADLAARFPDKRALFTAVLVGLEKALDAHCRAASSDPAGRPMAMFIAGCRAALEFGGRRDFARIVMIEGPVVLGEEAWIDIDHGLGLPTLRQALRNISPAAAESAVRPMAVMIMGALNELMLALARGERGVDIDASLVELERLLRAWAAR